MGFLLSKFWKKKTTKEQLDSIEQQIKSIEKFQRETEQQFRRVVGKLLFSSILIYIVAVIGYYYYFSPETFRDNIIKFLPLLVFPIVIILFRKLLTWYYRRKLSKNESTLKTLKTDKKKILEDVMDKETYKVAKEILEKYAPDHLSKEVRPLANSSLKAIMPATPHKPETTARQRFMNATPTDSLGYLSRQPGAFRGAPSAPPALAQPRLSLPRPILPRDRGAFDKLIDLIVGDGPGHRYALICKVCSSHNGMALKNEFEYLAFRCAYCLQWNPARKQKPQAPNLYPESGSQDDSDGNNSDLDLLEPRPNSEPFENESETKAIENESESDPQETTKTQRLEEETDPVIEMIDEGEFDEQSHPEEDSTDIIDEDNVPVSSENIDFVDLHRALEEIDDDVSSSSNAAQFVTSSPIVPEARIEGEQAAMDCSS